MLLPLRRALILAGLIAIMLAVMPQPAVHAGFFDRIKQIYNAPQQINELEGQYLEAKAELAEQQQKLIEAQQAAEEYARQQQEQLAATQQTTAEFMQKQEELSSQNKQLIEQNASLQAELAQMKEDRRSLWDKLLTTGITLAALLVAYIISLRLWRYLVWRKQRTSGRSGISG